MIFLHCPDYPMAAETGITPTHSKTACSCCTLINSCWAIPSSSPSTITPHTADSNTPRPSTPPPSFCWKGFCCSQYPHSATNCSCASSSILPPTCDCSDAPSAIPANEVAHCSPVATQYEQTVRPMHEAFVEPSRTHAHLCLPWITENLPAIETLNARIAAAVGL